MEDPCAVLLSKIEEVIKERRDGLLLYDEAIRIIFKMILDDPHLALGAYVELTQEEAGL